MSETDSPRQDRRISAVDVSEGDRVLMGVNWHGEASHGHYDRDMYQSVVQGEVVDAPRDSTKDLISDGERPMADFAVETREGAVFRWNVDNGYVIGPDGAGGRTDVGKFGGFYDFE